MVVGNAWLIRGEMHDLGLRAPILIMALGIWSQKSLNLSASVPN